MRAVQRLNGDGLIKKSYNCNEFRNEYQDIRYNNYIIEVSARIASRDSILAATGT
jgi:hypothetical protein